MSSRPAVSLVVCTRNRASRLASALRYIEALQFDEPWELVLVDNGSTDSTWTVLTEFADRFEGKVILVQAPERGLARAHNRALAASSGEIVAIIDDDCYPAPDYLEEVHRCFSEEPRLGFLGGRILLHDPSDLPITIRLLESRVEIRPGSFVVAGVVQGANMAFRRHALAEIGGFDEALGPGARFNCEDVDAAARVSAAGWMGAYDPRPVVRHHHGRKTAQEGRDLRRSYSHGRGAYYAKCLLDGRIRTQALRHWRSTISPRASRRFLHELRGAGHYLLSLSWLTRPRPADGSSTLHATTGLDESPPVGSPLSGQR